MSEQKKDIFFVVVIGESARSDRFSLNGYSRNTNPLLAKRKNLASFKNCHSLDTSTISAIPHIFMRDFNPKKDTQTEPSFIHTLKHLGLKSFWLSCWRTRPSTLIYDISLEANVTAYAPHIVTYNSDKSHDVLFYDHSLLEPLKETVTKNKNGIIVLHTKGSHNNYHYRTPKKFRIYSPHCADNCVHDLTSLSNTYDNTIVYTDYFLNEVIKILENKNAVLLYLSDHGESLGENGIFLHNAAFETAPKEQTHIPMIWWASNKFLSKKENLKKFLQIQTNSSKFVDQSYVFHSVLDCIGVDSNAINKQKSVCSKSLK